MSTPTGSAPLDEHAVTWAEPRPVPAEFRYPFDRNNPDGWEDPEKPRLWIETDEQYRLVADRVVRKQRLTVGKDEVVIGRGKIVNAGIADLRALIDAVQHHPDVRLARASKPDAEGFIRPTGVTRSDVTPTTESPTSPEIRGCVILTSQLSGVECGVDLTIRSTLAADARFDEARFAAAARFDGARFAADARFDGARFAAAARFDGARFAADARFDGAGFAAAAWFGDARFAADAWFVVARFAAAAGFDGARFAADARFGGARFAAAAGFVGARFAAAAWFDGARFAETASFDRAVFRCSGVRGEHRRHGEPLNDARPGLYLGDAVFTERISLAGVRFGRGTVLDVHRLLGQGDAVLELGMEQLRWAKGLVAARARPLRADRAVVLDWLWKWFGFMADRGFVVGENSKKPEDLRQAAECYDVLAANCRKLPDSNELEDHCRFRAHELRGRERRLRLLGDIARSLRGRGRWRSMWGGVTGLVEVAVRGLTLLVRELLWEWFVQRLCLGYLLQMHRVVATSGAILLAGMAVYALAASPDTIVQGNLSVPAAYIEHPWRFGLYFSLTTFVTLGYGDYAPTGWLKIVTGTQALLGVTLLALFTVAWGRKMVR